MLTYPWKCTVLYCNHLGNTWKPLVLMTRHFDYCPSASECENMYCVGRFKCPASYCISLDHICNKACDYPHCEDESIYDKLLCPGMVLIEEMGSGLRCSNDGASLKHSMFMRQVIRRKDLNITNEFPVFIHLEGVENLPNLVLTPDVVVYCKILHSKSVIGDIRIFHRMVSVRQLLLPQNKIGRYQ